MEKENPDTQKLSRLSHVSEKKENALCTPLTCLPLASFTLCTHI